MFLGRTMPRLSQSSMKQPPLRGRVVARSLVVQAVSIMTQIEINVQENAVSQIIVLAGTSFGLGIRTDGPVETTARAPRQAQLVQIQSVWPQSDRGIFLSNILAFTLI